MAHVFVLTFLSPIENHVIGEKHCFTTLIALFDYFDYKEIKVAYGYARGHNFKQGPFQAKYITIEKLPLLNKREVAEMKKKIV